MTATSVPPSPPDPAALAHELVNGVAPKVIHALLGVLTQHLFLTALLGVWALSFVFGKIMPRTAEGRVFFLDGSDSAAGRAYGWHVKRRLHNRRIMRGGA